MEENPYKSPREFKTPNRAPKDERWHPFTWGVIGFAVGTLLASLFVESPNRIDRAIGGAIVGGLPTGLYFFMSVVEKRRRENESSRD
jgi:hypothetical protein